ncbi:hypothetical protein [Lederbergia galactosidilytica]|uniref:Uncharacterized protein n=1 Tax=Lederbergia galactosidilytica TaxID=217031 RepID=A0A177ZR66_9BACI|nr:hypothetical protein [Lederbergia galactosidilytica]OAK70093.1 hypothetical protein ABB05_13005 [Lederbergia galactosidilytica]
MKPPMRQKVTVHFPVLDEKGQPVKDKYGKPLTKPKTSKARVQFKTSLIRDAKGEERRVSLEIDMPPSFNPPDGTKVEYTTMGGQKAEGTIITKDEAVNLAGSKVYYRTAYVDG